MSVQIQRHGSLNFQRAAFNRHISAQLIGAVGQAAGHIIADVALRQLDNCLALATQRHRDAVLRRRLLRWVHFRLALRLFWVCFRIYFLLLLLLRFFCRGRAAFLRGKGRHRQQRQTQAQCR